MSYGHIVHQFFILRDIVLLYQLMAILLMLLFSFLLFLKNNFCFIYIKQQFPVFQSVILILCLQDDNYRKTHFPRFLNEKPATFIYFLGIGPLLFLNSTWLEMHSMVSASKQLPATCVLFGSQVFYRINNGPHSFVGNTFKEMVTP